MPEAVVNHRQEDPVRGTADSVPDLDALFEATDHVLVATGAIEGGRREDSQ